MRARLILSITVAFGVAVTGTVSALAAHVGSTVHAGSTAHAGATVPARSTVPARATGSTASAGSPKTVHLRGTAYEFNQVHTLLAGATIRVAEFPKRSAVVGANGRYDLTVPNHARVTPYIVAAGYHTIYLQTFTTDNEDLANVNFQTPSNAVYGGLVLLLGVSTDASGNPVKCAIVSTFNTRNVRDLNYQGFIDYGAHGVAGATATASPALPKPIYFNKNVVPDRSQAESSEDGGVVWTGVPAGVYTVTAHSSTTRFARFVASCRPGRVINANPPWGLHELGLANPARATATFSRHGTKTTLSSMRVTRLPADSTVTVRCSGHGCRFSAADVRRHVADVRRAPRRRRADAAPRPDVRGRGHRPPIQRRRVALDVRTPRCAGPDDTVHSAREHAPADALPGVLDEYPAS